MLFNLVILQDLSRLFQERRDFLWLHAHGSCCQLVDVFSALAFSGFIQHEATDIACVLLRLRCIRDHDNDSSLMILVLFQVFAEAQARDFPSARLARIP